MAFKTYRKIREGKGMKGEREKREIQSFKSGLLFTILLLTMRSKKTGDFCSRQSLNKQIILYAYENK